MTYTLNRIGLSSAVKISAIISAAAAVLPIACFLLLNAIFKFWDAIIPPDVLIPMLASAAFWAAFIGGLSTAIAVLLYNICAPLFGGITLELKPHHPPRKQKEEIEID